jgi:hypothetical protein
MKSNQLIHEKSPYLLQHAHNPVEWHPWSEAAFEDAKRQDKPIFLSIGYATCHWCHVMERESFGDEEAAAYLNDTFICIKVDREERPDIDAVYMAASQMLTGRGGWPLTVFMTPDRKPFFASTYIPKQTRFGQPGLMDLCQQVKRIWATERQAFLNSAAAVAGNLRRAFDFSAAGDMDDSVLDQGFLQLKQSFDPVHGGFDPAPKFPTPHRLFFLLRYYHRTGQTEALDMVEKTLIAMRLGGIWDHVGFGFHRYSTDSKWLLPHFEKMLYDQALMALAYIEAFQITGREMFAQTAREIFTYVLRDMCSEQGGFFAAEDADSDGEEGRFYVWTPGEFNACLGAEHIPWADIFTIEEGGNFKDEAAGIQTGASIPHLIHPLEDRAKEWGMTPCDMSMAWEKIRSRLFAQRRHRNPPFKDDKILTDWNGMMITALAAAARVLNHSEYALAAERAARFIMDRMRTTDGRLLHRFREGEAGIAAHADDYAFVIQGLLAVYRADFDPIFLKWAVELQNQMIKDFWDTKNGGFFLSHENREDLPVRPKEVYDGAAPSANSVSLQNLLALARLTGDARWEEYAAKVIRAFAGSIKAYPSAYAAFLCGCAFSSAPSQEVVVAGEPDDPQTLAMRHALDRGFAPWRTVLMKSESTARELENIAPFTKSITKKDGKTTAYVCSGASCGPPITDIETLTQLSDQP